MPAEPSPPPLPLRCARTRAGTRLLAVGVLLVLGGLVGMHGLDGHGTAPAPMTSHPAAQVRMDVSTGHAPETAAVAGADDTRHGPGSHGGMGSMKTLCLAVLTGALLALAMWLQARRKQAGALVTMRRFAGVEARGRDPAPPSRAQFSVWRC